MNRKTAITIDGPAAAGKSTIAKIIAQKLNYIYIDTGAMYRALTLRALESNLDINDEAKLVSLLDQTNIQLTQYETGQRVIVNGTDITEKIRSQEVTNNVSYIAKHPDIRKEMMTRQRLFAKHNGVVMDGRDIGTHVLPNAAYKFFLNASVDERAKRRYEENRSKGFTTSFDDLKLEIANRDQQDTERESAPLIKAKDAIEIDTTSLSIDQVAGFILKKVHKVSTEH